MILAVGDDVKGKVEKAMNEVAEMIKTSFLGKHGRAIEEEVTLRSREIASDETAREKMGGPDTWQGAISPEGW
jgi:hypothetical protein